MNTYQVPRTKYKKKKTKKARLFSYFVLGASYFVTGCTWDQFNPFKPPVPPPPPVESFVLRNGALVAEAKPREKSAEAELAGAREYFRREEYGKAERLYHHIANNDKNPQPVVQEAIYYEAECLRMQGDLPKAADTYANLLKNHMVNPYKDLATQHVYEIAYYWLQDTWEEVKESKERREGKRWVVLPRFVSFDKRKPLLDREGRAVERLKDVYTYEGKGGAYADKAMYLCGYVAWFNENFSDADLEFSNLHKTFPDSPYAPYSLELAIKAKMMSTGGELYDGRKVADARKMVDEALRMPQMSDEKKQDLMKLMGSINAHQSEKDFQMAEFYRRTGHPGSAYFYYEIVRRRYPGTDAANRATTRMQEIWNKSAADQRQRLGAPPESDGRPTELLPPARRIDGPAPLAPPGAPMAPAGPETAPMPRKMPPDAGTIPPPRPLPPGIGGN